MDFFYGNTGPGLVAWIDREGGVLKDILSKYISSEKYIPADTFM